MIQGRQRERTTLYPPMAPMRPTTPTSLPRLPLEGNAKDDTQVIDDNHQEKEVRRDGTSGGASSTTESHASPDVSEPCPAPSVQHNEGRSENAEGDEVIVVEETACSCCDRKSTKLVTCEPCGQQFHIDCMSLEQNSGTMLCRQCIADYTMIGTVGDGNKSTDGLLTQTHIMEQENLQCSEALLTESSSSNDESEPSSFSQTTPTKRKTTSVHSSITKCMKKTAKSTVTAESTTSTTKTEQMLSQESTQTNKTTNDTEHGKKSIQSKLTKSSDTGTIQLTRPIRKTRQQTNSLPRKQTQL